MFQAQASASFLCIQAQSMYKEVENSYLNYKDGDKMNALR